MRVWRLFLFGLAFQACAVNLTGLRAEGVEKEKQFDDYVESIRQEFADSPSILAEKSKLDRKYPQKDIGAAKYERSGHQFTTYIVARLAGMDLNRAYKLAHFSQFPDDEVRFSATMAFLYVWDLAYRKQVMAVLHSLHGGDHDAVLKRRAGLKRLIANGIKEKSLKDHQLGMIIHAFADSYAHVAGDEGKLHAFGYVIGHLFHGHKPDIIAYAPERFKNFACKLFQALSQKHACLPKLKNFLRMVDRLESSRDDELLKIENFAVDRLHFDWGEYERRGATWNKQVGKDEVTATTMLIEKAIN